jgi:hypothetical protein
MMEVVEEPEEKQSRADQGGRWWWRKFDMDG